MKYVILDVREPYEFEQGHVDGAINIPPARLMNGAKELDATPKDAKILVYCHTGSRSKVAQHILKSQGYTDITNGINKEQVEARFLR